MIVNSLLKASKRTEIFRYRRGGGGAGDTPVLKINDHATGGRRTKDILGGPEGWGPKKEVANVEIYVIFEVFAFCGGRTKTDFKDRASNNPKNPPLNFFSEGHNSILL